MDPLPQPAVVADLTDSIAWRIACRAVVADIESEALACTAPDGSGRWLDTRPMLDPREHSPVVIDMAREALDFAAANGLVTRHAEWPGLVRVTALGLAG